MTQYLFKAALTVLALVIGADTDTPSQQPGDAGLIRLPKAKTEGVTSVSEALAKRRSVRTFVDEPLDAGDLSQLLWAAQGITDKRGYRTAPSAGALYPLEVFVVVGKVNDIPAGTYRYVPRGHALKALTSGDRRKDLAEAALRQSWIAEAPAVIVIGGVYERTAAKYGQRAERYVHIEAGCAAENVSLQAVAIDLGTTVVGAFIDESVRKVVAMNADEKPLIVIPVGRPKKKP